MKKIFIIGSSKGIGNAIYRKINKKRYKVYAPKRNILDTSNIQQVINFVKKIKKVDILIFNSMKKMENVRIEKMVMYF